MHLTIGVHPVTRHALVETLAALAAEVPALRDSLPLGLDLTDPTTVAPELTAVVDALSDWLRTADPAVVAERLRTRVWPQGRSEPVSPLAQARAVASLEADGLVRLRKHLRYTVASGADDAVVLRLPDRTLTLPAITASAMKTVFTGAPVRASDLPGLDTDDGLVLLRRLLREGLVVPA